MNVPYQHPTEPNAVDFDAHGYPCVIRRMHIGHLCGYVFVPPGHPWHGKEPSADVHGGVTYSATAAEFVFDHEHPDDKRGLSDWWAVGFDCNHSGDLSPANAARFGALAQSVRDLLGVLEPYRPTGVYRDISYVRLETERLALQAAEATGPCLNAGEIAQCEGP